MEATMKTLTIIGSKRPIAMLCGRARSRTGSVQQVAPSSSRSLVQRCPVKQHLQKGQRVTEAGQTTTSWMTYQSDSAVVSEEEGGGGGGRGGKGEGRAANGQEMTTAASQLKPMDSLSGPTGWPIVGNFLMYLQKENRGKMHEVQARLHKTYGKMFREKWGSNWQVHVCDPELIEVIIRQEGRYPNRPPLAPWVLYRRLAKKPNGLVTAQGSEWQLLRNEMAKRMLCPNASKNLVPPINEVAVDLVDRLRYVRDTDGDVALVRGMANELYRWSLEAAGTFLFETRLGCMERIIPPRTQQFIDATQEMMTSSLYLIVGERIHQKLNTRFWRRHETAWDKIFEIGKELIDERIKELLEETKEGRDVGNSGVYLTYLLGNENLTMDQIFSNVTELLLAGSDSTANSFCFIAHLLAQHENVQEKLYDEVTSVLEGSQKEITSDTLEEMKYLKCVIKEGMRLYPVATMNCRILDEDIILDGHLIPKKTLFVLNHYAAAKDDTVFPKAEEFLPERWMREGLDGMKHHPFACLPFGFGKRNCAGQRVAKMELMISLIKVLQSFRIEPYPGLDFNPVLRTLLTPGDNVPVRFVDRFPQQ